MSSIRDNPVTTSTTYNKKYYVLKNYIPGVERTAFIGQSMITVSDYMAITELKTYKGIHFKPSKAHQLIVKHENKFGKVVETIIPLDNNEYEIDLSTNIQNLKYYIVRITDSNGNTWGLLIDDKNMISDKYIVNNEMNRYHKIISITPSVGGISYAGTVEDTVDREPRYVPADLNYELIYSGLNKVAVNITYREFTRDNIARAAFFQNLSYEPGSKQIRFRDTLINIEEITNEKIRYTVVSDGLPDNPTDNIKQKLYKVIEELKTKK